METLIFDAAYSAKPFDRPVAFEQSAPGLLTVFVSENPIIGKILSRVAMINFLLFSISALQKLFA
jgi:hypothetical protein